MTPLEEVLARHEITALSHAFARTLDHGGVEEFLALFTADVSYRSGERVMSGTEELRNFFTKRASSGRVSRHLMTGLAINFDGPDRAEGTSCWLTFAGQGALPVEGCKPYLVADVVDVYRREAAGWRIARRTIQPIFRDAALAPGGAG